MEAVGLRKIDLRCEGELFGAARRVGEIVALYIPSLLSELSEVWSLRWRGETLGDMFGDLVGLNL